MYLIRRLLLGLVVLLFVTGIVVAFLPMFVPEADAIFQTTLCPSGSEVIRREQSANDGGIRVTYQCEDAQGVRAEPSILPFIVLYSAWCWLPLIPIVVLLLLPRAKRPETVSIVQTATPISAISSGDSLANKLKQLEEAYQAGLLTEAQYQQAKQEVLDNLTGN